MYILIVLLLSQLAFAGPLSDFQSQLSKTAEQVMPVVVKLPLVLATE